MMHLQETVDYIVNWLKEYANTSGLKGFVIGISGGIDSALTSTLCAKTGLPVTVLSMPIHQAPDQLSRAHEHINWLKQHFPNVASHEIDLTATFENFKQAVPDSTHNLMALANSRSRLRMLTLYNFAQSEGKLVAGTGNKVEDFGVGFYTKYGDGGVDVSPIADLYKSQVFILAAHLGVSESIIEAKPTDGLWDDDRSDEDQLGATYPELEWAMAFENGELDIQQLSAREEEVLQIYRKFHSQNKHKMLPIPVCQIPTAYL